MNQTFCYVGKSTSNNAVASMEIQHGNTIKNTNVGHKMTHTLLLPSWSSFASAVSSFLTGTTRLVERVSLAFGNQNGSALYTFQLPYAFLVLEMTQSFCYVGKSTSNNAVVSKKIQHGNTIKNTNVGHKMTHTLLLPSWSSFASAVSSFLTGTTRLVERVSLAFGNQNGSALYTFQLPYAFLVLEMTQSFCYVGKSTSNNAVVSKKIQHGNTIKNTNVGHKMTHTLLLPSWSSFASALSSFLTGTGRLVLAFCIWLILLSSNIFI